MSREDELAAQARAMIAELQDSLAEVRAVTAEIIEEGARERAEDERQDEERARRARAGDLGQEWRRIQERIDRGETTPAAVARGWDDSREADALRDTAVHNMVELKLLMEAEADGEARAPVINISGTPGRHGFRMPPEARRAMAEAKDSMARLSALEDRLHSLPLPDED